LCDRIAAVSACLVDLDPFALEFILIDAEFLRRQHHADVDQSLSAVSSDDCDRTQANL